MPLYRFVPDKGVLRSYQQLLSVVERQQYGKAQHMGRTGTPRAGMVEGTR
jgi:hypothetical protein